MFTNSLRLDWKCGCLQKYICQKEKKVKQVSKDFCLPKEYIFENFYLQLQLLIESMISEISISDPSVL